MRSLRVVLVVGLLGLLVTAVPIVVRTPSAAADTVFAVVTRSVTVSNGDRALPTSLYFPAGGPRAWPAVVFAHGYNTDPSTYDVLLRAWASAGYVVAAPASPGLDPRLGSVSTANLADQASDVSATITFLLAGMAGVAVDPSRVAAAGHSDGGSTVARLAIGQQARDDRPNAFLVLSGALDIPDRYGPTNAAPLFASVGTDDEFGDYPNTRQVYDTAASPKVFVSVQGGGHLAPYIDDDARGARLRAATVDFLNGALDVRRLAWDDLGADGNEDGLRLDNGGVPIPDPLATMQLLEHFSAASGVADATVSFGARRDQILYGDWDGDGTRTIGVWRDATATFYLSDDNVHTNAVIPFGDPGDHPIVGDWNGSGRDMVGVERQGQWFLRFANTPGAADASFFYGDPGDEPLVGNWTGQPATTVGVHRGARWFLRDTNTSGIADQTFVYGDVGDEPLVGDWNCNGTTTIGVHRGAQWFLRDTNTTGTADRNFVYGNEDDTPFAARFGTSACTTPAVVR